MKKAMNTFAQRSIRAWLLLGLLGYCGWVVAQTMPEPRTSDGRAFSTLSEEERKAQPFADRIAYNKWQKSRLEAEAKELDEKLAQSDLITDILKQNAADPNNLAKRQELQQQLSRMPSLLSDPILGDFSRDYLAGKPMTVVHILAIQRWNTELKVPRQ